MTDPTNSSAHHPSTADATTPNDAAAPGEPSRESADQRLWEQKRSDPRASITRRGILIGIIIFFVAVIAAGLSVYMRRTHLEKTTEFWGEDTITALQLADRVHLLAGPGQSFEDVELTATPGFGHLRRALLDERNYQWETVQDVPVSQACGEDSLCVTLRFADPTGKRVPVTEIDLELNSGWVGPARVAQRVQVSDRARPALRHQLKLLMNVTQETYDERNR